MTEQPERFGRGCYTVGSPCGAGSRCPQCPGETPRPLTPVNPPTAIRAVEDEVAELSLEVGLHLQQLEAQHLRVDGSANGRPSRLAAKSRV